MSDSNNELRASLVFSQSAAAAVEALGMISENMARAHRGESMAFTADSFNSILTMRGLDYNKVVAYLFDK